MITGPIRSGKTTAIKTVVQSLTSLHQMEIQQKTVLFQLQKARVLNIDAQEDVDGIVRPKNHDPMLEAKLKIKSEEIALISDVCAFKGVNNITICPKSVTINQLMGNFDETSREWTDGLISAAMRNAAFDTTGREMLITLDGPIEPDWVENINSVLDDNKRLNLVTGEVIYMTDRVKILIETADLTNTSPATISRCAIIYCAKEQLPNKSIFNSWLISLPPILQDQKRRLDQFFNFFMRHIFQYYSDRSRLVYPIGQSWIISSFVSIIEGLICDYRHNRYNDERVMEKIYAKFAETE